jgi:quercetin dioxygenase-like cupin family protein
VSLLAKIRTIIIMRTGRGFKVGSGESRTGEHFTMRGVTMNTLDLKVSAEDTGGDLAVFEQTGSKARGGPPMHIHPNQDEMFYVIEGEYRFRVGDDEYPMKAGDTIFLPRNVPHAFVQLTEKARVIVAYQPAGKMESFFRKTASWTNPPTAAEIARVFEEHDMVVVGPPLNAD